MRSLYNYLWVLAFLVLIQSCLVTKNYERPEEVVPESDTYRLGPEDQDTSSIADIEWREVFTDELLQGYIGQALDSNLDIRIAVENIEQAESFLNQAKANYVPVINAQMGYTGMHPSVYDKRLNRISKDYLNQFDISANLSWEADIWGKLKSQEKAANADFLQTVAAQKMVQTQIVASVASIYYQLLTLDEQINVAKESIRARKESLETTRSLKEAGIPSVTAAAVKQTEAQVYDAEITLISLKNTLKQMEHAFSVILGDYPESIERSSLSDQHMSTELRTGVPAVLLRNRPDVIAAEYGLISAFELTNVAKANFYPSLTLTANTGLSSLEKNPFSGKAFLASISAGLLQPILNRRQIRTQYEVAQSQQEVALLNYRKAMLEAGQDVSDALSEYQAATEMIGIQEKQVDALNLATDYSQQLLNNGLANYLEVLTAEQQSLGAQLQLADTKFQELNAVVSLYRSLGGGWN